MTQALVCEGDRIASRNWYHDAIRASPWYRHSYAGFFVHSTGTLDAVYIDLTLWIQLLLLIFMLIHNCSVLQKQLKLSPYLKHQSASPTDVSTFRVFFVGGTKICPVD